MRNMRNILVIAVILTAGVISCKKESTPPPVKTCDVTGIYNGTAKDRFNTLIPNTYRFFENNYATSSAGLTQPDNAFGGYRNTCDSIVWNMRNTINNHKYLYKCALSENGTKLTGTYQDLDNPVDIGTLDLQKQ